MKPRSELWPSLAPWVSGLGSFLVAGGMIWLAAVSAHPASENLSLARLQQKTDLSSVAAATNGTLSAQGEAVFGKTCVFCHQANGLGLPGQFPPLAGSEWINAPDPNRILRIVLHGLSGPIQVKDQKWDATMPPLGAVLSDEEIAAALTFVRQSWQNKAPPVKPEQVKAIREQVGDRVEPWSAEELLQLPAGG